MGNKLLVAIPAYNEDESIGAFIEKLKNYKMWDMFDLIVVNDGSSDKTEEVCRNAGVKVLTHVFNMGYGAALKTAYKYADENGYDYIIQIDGDGQHDVCNIERIYNTLTADKQPVPDIVIGSRFLKGSETFKVSPAKRIVMGMFNLMVRISTRKKITDPTSGLQGISRKAFNFYSKYNNFAMEYPDINMIIQMFYYNYNIVEIPAVMHKREAGESMHAGLKPIAYLINMMISTIAVIMRGKPNV